MTSLQEDWENGIKISEQDKGIILAWEAHRFRQLGKRPIRKGKLTNTFKAFIKERGLSKMLSYIEHLEALEVLE